MLDYDALLARTDAPAGSSWGLFGADDELGTLNFLTSACVLAASGCIRRGEVFNLDLPLDAFRFPLFRHRRNLRHHLLSNAPHHRDDRIDRLFLQTASQIDGLRHMRHPHHAFYNGVMPERIVEGDPTLGIQRFAEHGIVGRGVLLDLPRFLRRRARPPIDHMAGEAFDTRLLDEVAGDQNVRWRHGDILLVRTGWLEHYFNERSENNRRDLPSRMRASGLAQAHHSLRWLWNHRFALVAFDNPGVEALPAVADTPFIVRNPDGSTPANGLMHPYLIGLMGFALGELWDLERLAEDCERDRIYECMVVAKPLNLPGGVGSPCNATAIK